jgi:hypothetical protein
MWLVAQRRNVARDSSARIDHRGRSRLLDLPTKKLRVELLRLGAVLAANLEMHNGMSHRFSFAM